MNTACQCNQSFPEPERQFSPTHLLGMAVSTHSTTRAPFNHSCPSSFSKLCFTPAIIILPGPAGVCMPVDCESDCVHECHHAGAFMPVDCECDCVHECHHSGVCMSVYCECDCVHMVVPVPSTGPVNVCQCC